MSKGAKGYQAKLNATLDYVKILKDQGLNPNEYLTQDQRTVLAEEEYRNERKRQLGGCKTNDNLGTLDRLQEERNVDAFLA